ncbi:hypothetical protein WR25_04200 [Diploscapter pachys]|uniref:AMP-dependent synthetase/ligase domain-containing protein n=1 Tax=Diploscapter pachys TaxID=2018661 RepID=A0A2A2JTQ8_9BILA|nr:hypothetical protein WR25_04200 [Diploscapter pachys]
MSKPFDLSQYSITVTVDENPSFEEEEIDSATGSEEEEEEEEEIDPPRSRLVLISQELLDQIDESGIEPRAKSKSTPAAPNQSKQTNDEKSPVDIPIKLLDTPSGLKPTASTKIADIGRRFGEITIPQNDKNVENSDYKPSVFKQQIITTTRKIDADNKLTVQKTEGISKNSSFLTVELGGEDDISILKSSLSPSLIGLRDFSEVPPAAELQIGGDSSDISSFYYPDRIIEVPLRLVGRMPKRDLPKADVFSRWIFHHLYAHRNEQPTRIAVIEEVNETRCLTYAELVNNVLKAANFLSHHKILPEMCVALCMENSIEFLTFQLALIAIGATPILLSPGHVASDKIEPFDCEAMIVDHSHYGHILRSYETFGRLEHVFILTEDLCSIYVPRHVWIYDAYGFLDFSPDYRKMLPVEDGHVIAFSTRSYAMHVLAKGETCIITEATYDVWRASFLDRLAQLIEQYKVALLFTNVQLLRCFLKYGAEKIYNLSSLKIVANTGSPLPEIIASRIRETLNVAVTQAYSSAETGIISFDDYRERNQQIVSSGYPFINIQLKIADIETEKELPSAEWGRVMLQGNQLFCTYLSKSYENRNLLGRNWLRTDDYGKIENDGRLYVAGHIQSLIRVEGQMVAPDIIESVLFTNPCIEDCVVSEQSGSLWAGLVVKEDSSLPDAEQLNSLLKSWIFIGY